LTPDHARELFGAAFANELTDPERASFEAMLCADPALDQEYRAFVAFCEALRHPGSPQPDQPTPDLLPGVQRRLRARSRGRFYRDRFAERLGTRWQPTVLIALAMLVLLALAWLGLRAFEAVTPR
jgi:hypothetical protein